jgi:anti-sigma regulatory factor (Ser/Thr protein kinase)
VVDAPLDHRPVTAQQLFAAPFALTDLARVRHRIEAVSGRCGLSDIEVEDWITAVNELLINAVRHGGGRGTVRLLLEARLTCEVTDQGAGFDPTRYVRRSERPPLSAEGGMGLWTVGQLAEFLHVDSGPTGTTIRIAARADSPVA